MCRKSPLVYGLEEPKIKLLNFSPKDLPHILLHLLRNISPCIILHRQFFDHIHITRVIAGLAELENILQFAYLDSKSHNALDDPLNYVSDMAKWQLERLQREEKGLP